MSQDHVAWTDRSTKDLTWAHKSDGSIEREATSDNSLGAIVTWDTHQQPEAVSSEYIVTKHNYVGYTCCKNTWGRWESFIM